MAAVAPTRLQLNTGASIPALGFGTWRDQDVQEEAVLAALKAGYRHIDTAHVYGTETAVGSAIRKSGVPRSEIFLVTKLWNNSHGPEDVEPALDASLEALGTDYVDLYLMHWPCAFKTSKDLRPKDSSGKVILRDTDYVDTYRAMEACFEKGKAKAIGVSNFSHAEMRRLLEHASIKPAVHQIECHPYLQQEGFTAWHKSVNVHVTQYSPLGNQNVHYTKHQHVGKLIEDPILLEIAKKYGKSGAQVALAWAVAHGRSCIPKSKSPHRIEENLAGDFKLDSDDLEKIATIDKKLRYSDPSEVFGMNFFADLEGKQ